MNTTQLIKAIVESHYKQPYTDIDVYVDNVDVFTSKLSQELQAEEITHNIVSFGTVIIYPHTTVVQINKNTKAKLIIQEN